MDCNRKYIYIFKGDDTDFNNDKFVTIHITASAGVDLSTMTAEFALGSYVKKDIPLATGQFDIELNRETTANLSYGPICGRVRIYDEQGRVKTAANTIPFFVTDKIIVEQDETISIELPEGSPVSIDIVVGEPISYNDLDDKPKLNGVTIQGEKTSEDYGLVTTEQLAEKQDVISDLQQIREGSLAGSTAVQPEVLQNALVGKQDVSNLVTSINSSSTNAQYPSAKCVYDIVGDIEALLSEV